MAIKGSLKEASLADVCQLLSLGQKTGCLSISDRSNFGQIYFEQGRITYARVVNRRDRLGDLLVRDGLITHDQLRRAVDQQSRNPDLRLGEILIERRLDRAGAARSGTSSNRSRKRSTTCSRGPRAPSTSRWIRRRRKASTSRRSIPRACSSKPRAAWMSGA